MTITSERAQQPPIMHVVVSLRVVLPRFHKQSFVCWPPVYRTYMHAVLTWHFWPKSQETHASPELSSNAQKVKGQDIRS